VSHRGPLHLVAACLVLAALVRPVSLPATPGTLTLADAPVLTIDPACTFSSVVLQFRNDGPTPVTLAPAASEVTTVAGKPSGARVAFRPVFDLAGKTDAEIVAVEPGKSVYVRADVQDVLQEGAWDIDVKNHGIKIGTFKVTRAKVSFAVKLDVPNPDAPQISLESGVPKLLAFTNADDRANLVRWEFEVDGKEDVASGNALVLPANGAGQVNFTPPSGWFSLKSLLKDQTGDGRLTVRLRCTGCAGPACAPSMDAPTKTFKVKLNLAICSADWQALWADGFVLFTLLLGAGASFFVNLVVPNYFSRRDFRTLLSEIDGRVASLPMALSSRLRVLAGIERKSLEESTRYVSFYSLEFKSRITQLKQSADQLSSRVDLLQQIGTDRIRFEALRAQATAPTLVDEIEDLFEEVIQGLDSVGLNDKILASAKGTVAQIEKAMDDLHKPGPDFGSQLATRAKMLKKEFAKSAPPRDPPNPIGDSATTERIAKALPELFAELKVAPEDANGFTPDYAKWDMILYKLDLVRRYVCWRDSGQLANPAKLDAIEKELAQRLLLFSWEGLDFALRYVREIEQNIYAEDIQTQLNPRSVTIRMDRFAVRQFAPTQFRLEFAYPAYNTAEAQQDWTCIWYFDHGPKSPGNPDRAIMQEYGWMVTHYFPQAGTYQVKVRFQRQQPNGGDYLDPLAPLSVDVSSTQQDDPRERRHLRNRKWAEAIQVFVAILPALVGLMAGAKDQVLKLDFIPAALAIIVIGFGSDQIKSKLMQ